MDDKIHSEAVKFIKSHKQELIKRFASDEICSKEKDPVSIFMAGSPGAGKTEFSKRFLRKWDMVRIDADEIKDFIPQYNKKNSSDVQGASSLGVEKLYDYVLDARKSAILDGTFANYKKAYTDVSRSIKRKRPTAIFYIYQDPLIAWKFTKAREALEGRRVPNELLIT